MNGCPICGSLCTEDFYVKDSRQLIICASCRHVWWRTLPNPVELKEYYQSAYTKAHSQACIQAEAVDYYRSHVLELASVLGRKPNEITLLDYGCSVPVLGREAVKLSFGRVIGVDWAEDAKQYGKDWGVSVICPSEVVSLPDRSVNVARFSHVIEHSIDPVGLLLSILPKMRRGGLIYITQPNFPVFRAATSPHDLLDTVYPEHLHFFSALSLTEMTSACKLRIIRFFSHQNEASVVRKFEANLDLEYARERLAPYATLGDPYFSDYANFPFYAGENSALYAMVDE